DPIPLDQVGKGGLHCQQEISGVCRRRPAVTRLTLVAKFLPSGEKSTTSRAARMGVRASQPPWSRRLISRAISCKGLLLHPRDKIESGGLAAVRCHRGALIT